MPNREVELKWEVDDERGLEQLEAALGGTPAKVVRQRNVYFDAEHRLAAAGWSVRLRVEDGRNRLAIKGPRDDTAGYVARPETPDVEVDDDARESILDGEDPLPHLLAALDETPEGVFAQTVQDICAGLPLKRTGETNNERRKYPVSVAGLALTVEIDRTDYAEHGVFYEAELEIPGTADEATRDAVQAWLREIFERLGLPIREAPGKLARLRALTA
ncbi:MAG: CYTH domain-containing protein [Deltaproteobacteria bacterium]